MSFSTLPNGTNASFSTLQKLKQKHVKTERNIFPFILCVQSLLRSRKGLNSRIYFLSISTSNVQWVVGNRPQPTQLLPKARAKDQIPAPPLQNASNEPVNVKENEIPDAVFIKKEAETTENGKENTLANQENIENGVSAEEGEGKSKTSSDKTKEDDGAGGEEEEEKLNSCDHFPRHFFSPTSRNHEEESIASANDPATKNEEGLKSEDAGNQVVTNTIDENKVSSSVGEEKIHVEEKESGNNATSTTDTKTN